LNLESQPIDSIVTLNYEEVNDMAT